MTDPGNIHSRIAQQGLGPIQTSSNQVLMRCLLEKLFKQLEEVVRRKIGNGGHIPQHQLAVRAWRDIVACQIQAAVNLPARGISHKWQLLGRLLGYALKAQNRLEQRVIPVLQPGIRVTILDNQRMELKELGSQLVTVWV